MPGREIVIRDETPTKAEHRRILLEYLSDPENEDQITKVKLAEVLGISRKTLYEHFSPDELNDILHDALIIRRRSLVPKSIEIDRALFKKCLTGNVEAIKLYYQRFEGWSEKQTITFEFGDNQIRDYAIKNGYDPDEFLAFYKSKLVGVKAVVTAAKTGLSGT